MMKKFAVPLFAGVVGAAALAVPASAAPIGYVVAADLDGDGTPDRVVLEAVAGDPGVQSLVATVNGVRFTARPPMNSYPGVLEPRVVDLNGDGKDEVLVVESSGANTEQLGVWRLYQGGVRAMRTPDGNPLQLWEGGGISAISRYGCEGVGSGRRLVTVGAVLADWGSGVYQGERVVYAVQGRITTVISRTPVTGGRDAPLLQADPQACA